MKRERALVLMLILILEITFMGCKNMKKIILKSPAFTNNSFIPEKYTCDGIDISPELLWEKIPENTKSLAIICDDPDAPMGTWVHWVIYNIPPDFTSLKENFPKVKRTEKNILQGINDFGKVGYGGPCPPPGKAHRYFFKIYAIDKNIDTENLTKSSLLKEIEGHIIGYGELIGLYKR